MLSLEGLQWHSIPSRGLPVCRSGDAVWFLSLRRRLGRDNGEGFQLGHGRVRELLRLSVLCHRCSYDTLSRIDAAGDTVFVLGQEVRYGLLDLIK